MVKSIKAYDIMIWEEVLKSLPGSCKNWFKKERAYLRKNITKNARVLDVGCGEGRSLKDISGLTKNLTGVDHDPQAIKKNEKLF
ncbi:MAG: class I SAM-dependent methyltransferase [Nanoarchaeota archaeon]